MTAFNESATIVASPVSPATNVGQDGVLSHIQFALFQGVSAAEMKAPLS